MKALHAGFLRQAYAAQGNLKGLLMQASILDFHRDAFGAYT